MYCNGLDDHRLQRTLSGRAGSELKNIYLGWIAFNNDPYKWVQDKGLWGDPDKRFKVPREVGPAISFMMQSKFKGAVNEVHLLAQNDPHSKEVVSLLKSEIKEHKVTPHWVDLECVIDHQEILEKMMVVLPSIIGNYGKERVRFLINISPGTPAMQFVWLLITQAGRGIFDPHEVEVFQGNPPEHRKCKTDPNEALRQIDLKIPTLWNLAREPFAKAHQGLERPGRATQDRDEKVVSQSMISCRELMRKAAAFDFPVTLLGERGVGKTTNALKWIHKQGSRRDGPFEEIVSGAYPDEADMKAEMFGWKKGSFTGAENDYNGAIKIADKGRRPSMWCKNGFASVHLIC